MFSAGCAADRVVVCAEKKLRTVGTWKNFEHDHPRVNTRAWEAGRSGRGTMGNRKGEEDAYPHK
jgi:hypothetical protein